MTFVLAPINMLIVVEMMHTYYIYILIGQSKDGSTWTIFEHKLYKGLSFTEI